MRYFISQDQSEINWFIVPLDRKKEWYEWVNSTEDSEYSRTVPDWVFEVGRLISQIEFENPMIFDESCFSPNFDR